MHVDVRRLVKPTMMELTERSNAWLARLKRVARDCQRLSDAGQLAIPRPRYLILARFASLLAQCTEQARGRRFT